MRFTSSTLTAALFLLLSACAAQGQEHGILKPKDSPHTGLMGNIRFDLLASVPASTGELPQAGSSNPESKKKSVMLAALFSAAVPGVGEFYTESYWRAAGFLAAEAGLWIAYALYTGKGDEQTDLFQRFADEHWSVVRYAEWIEQNATRLNPNATGCTGIVVGLPGLPPWERVDWARLNWCEDVIGQNVGNGFTHRLPKRPDQQYYEQIGKYPQYAGGWDDAGYVTPEDIVTSNVSPRFRDYSAMRGKANDFFNIASTTASLLVVNHLLSAIDAAWSAAQFNNRLKVEARLTPTPRAYGLIEFVPTLRASLEF
ncbi:MAG: hypothetical protein FJ217_09190 [Ignavibacteria bacterium]|nr:hypothetical protein [Ignavibacteria bacterium]